MSCICRRSTTERRSRNSIRLRQGTVRVVVPPLQYLMLDGEGDPNTSAGYPRAIDCLYSVPRDQVPTQEPGDQNAALMVVVASLVDLAVLFPVAWAFRRGGRRHGPRHGRTVTA